MNIKEPEYKNFLIELKKKIHQSRNNALKSVNKELINLYWEIGKNIAEKINNYGWGKNVVESLSKDLKKEFPGIQGFSKDNLWRMVKFYEFYSKNKKLAPLVQEISWSNNILILEKCENNYQIEYYLKLANKTHLSKRVLQNKIESQEFERVLSENKTNNFDLTLEEENAQIVENTIKDSYIFDFLDLGDKYKEKELENNLLNNLKDFILELGIGFAYIGNQYNIKVDGEDYFLDMLFYHTKLKCYVIVELKIGEFKPEYAGKLNFYINLVDDKVKQQDDNSTIGLLICKTKDKEIAEYALRGQTNPLAIGEYSFENLSEDLKKNLPDVSKIKQFLEGL